MFNFHISELFQVGQDVHELRRWRVRNHKVQESRSWYRRLCDHDVTRTFGLMKGSFSRFFLFQKNVIFEGESCIVEQHIDLGGGHVRVRFENQLCELWWMDLPGNLCFTFIVCWFDGYQRLILEVKFDKNRKLMDARRQFLRNAWPLPLRCENREVLGYPCLLWLISAIRNITRSIWEQCDQNQA